MSHRQWPFAIEDLIVVIRSSEDPAALAAEARALIRAEDPALPVDSVMTMEDRVAASLAGPRSYAVFLVGFALCALAIAGVGLFGVLWSTTSQRTREIGLRTALGAQRGDVLALVGRQALVITAGGLAVGLVAAFFLSQSLSTLIYGISTRDALSFLVVPLVLVGVSIVACAAPAWRATRIDPLVALRDLIARAEARALHSSYAVNCLLPTAPALRRRAGASPPRATAQAKAGALLGSDRRIRGLDLQHHAVGRGSAAGALGGDVDVAVRALLHVANAYAERE